MTFYFDASAFGMLVFHNAGWPRIEALIADGADCLLSDFGWGEFASAVSIRLRIGSASEAEASAFLAGAAALAGVWLRERLDPTDVDVATALVMRFELALRLPDAIHIAIAQRTLSTLVTADARQAAAARAIGVTVFNTLEEPR